MASGASGAVRIIGGRWRRTRIPVAAQKELRPTADRIRETLFNWLAMHLPGARCLDLFAGTGALGFEALSRGAASCHFVEHDAILVAKMNVLKQRLDTSSAEILHADAFRWLKRTPQAFDIVFLDPPFESPLLDRALKCIEQGWTTAASIVYLEAPSGKLPETNSWQTIKQNAMRHVSYAIVQRSR